MGRYTRTPGSRSYGNSYTAQTLQKAIGKVRTGAMTIRKASRTYGIPYGTLFNKTRNKHTLKTGGQPQLTLECEQLLVRTVEMLGEWKIPMTGMDIKMFVKAYLDRLGVQHRRFTDNCPGHEWLRGFIARHNLTRRLADNVKPARVEVDQTSVGAYFDQLEETMRNVPGDNVYNYDETNITDEPGAKTIVCRRGLKRVERKIQHSKAAISIMYCGSATGIFLPPMVVYKAKNCYAEWMTGAPRGTIFDNTTSGWFDARCFERWFRDIFLVHTRNQPGRKVLIGDNLASHFTAPVIQGCIDNDIHFVCLVPNATHLLQPLDVSVFRPLKISWRNILETWRKESRIKGDIPKTQIPGLLSKLHRQLKPESLVSGFKATGIHPLNRNEVLKRLPNANQGEVNDGVFNEVVMDILKEHCGYDKKQKQRRGKKITPGKAVNLDDLQEAEERSSSTATTSGGGGSRGKKRASRKVIPDSSSETESVDDVEDDDKIEQEQMRTVDDSVNRFKSGQWVVIAYPPRKNNNSTLNYVGQILETDQMTKTLKVKFLKRQPGATTFKSPEVDDIDDAVPFEYAIKVLGEPSTNSRLQMIFSDIVGIIIQ